MQKNYRPGARLAELARAKREREAEELVKKTVEFFLGNTERLLGLVGEYDDLTKKLLDDQKKHVIAFAILAAISTAILIHDAYRLFFS